MRLVKDRFGLSWQVAPAGWTSCSPTPTRTRADRAMEAMLA